MKQWSLLIIWTATMRVVKMQFAMPMYAVNPGAMQVVVPAVAVQMPQSTATTTTTTTTTPRHVAVAVHVPVQMPVPFPMPAYAPPNFCQAKPRLPNCPPCPPCICVPSCTPSFFAYCSPCHQKCRCRSPDNAPLPMPPNPPIPFPAPAFPISVPGPPPLVVVPFPPSVRFPKIKHKPSFFSDTSSDTSTDDSRDTCSGDSCTSSDSDYWLKRARKRKKSHRKLKRILARRNMARSSDSEVVKPVLTYVSQNGNVKFKTKISNAEAAQLLGEKKFYKHKGKVETVQVVANEDAGNRPQVVVVSQDADDRSHKVGEKQIVLRSGSSKHVLQKGKKEIVFRPPTNKKISNLSVSFQVTE